MAKPLEIDGRVGEGGGQVVRIAVALAALITQPVKIVNIRGNRPRGGGLKNQHVTAIQWLAEATDAIVDGLSVGSTTLTFEPRLSPAEAKLPVSKDGVRRITVGGSNASSTMLILQAILPFLIFASGGPIAVEVRGGTNVDFSPSYEYLDQVLLPTLEERWSVAVERKVIHRSWSLGPQSGTGKISLKLNPVQAGQKLTFNTPALWKSLDSLETKSIDVSILTPSEHHATLQNQLAQDLGDLYPRVDVNFVLSEDSGNISRWYILLVAHSASGTRRGRDVLTSMPKKAKSSATFISQLSRKACKSLYEELSEDDWVDEHLRDQLICYQALSDGWSSMEPSGAEHSASLDGVARDIQSLDLDRRETIMRKEKPHEPFGKGSLHAQTARWVASELLPRLEVYNKGDHVKGVGFSTSAST
jgi:RNA 3'-terminal phosphate cyclase (ATP)